MRNTFINSLVSCAEKDDRIFLITADIGFSVVERFAEKFPTRFLNVGIAEQNAVGIAAGMAMSGKTVYVYSIIPFVLMRCFEQVRVDLAYQKTKVRLVGVGAGLAYGPAGATHHAIEDVAITRALPNMTVLTPGDPYEAAKLMEATVDHEGPIYFRLGKGGEPVVHSDKSVIKVGELSCVRQGSDVAIVSMSNILSISAQVAEVLAANGIRAGVYSAHTMKPFDRVSIEEFIRRKIPIVTIEEHSVVGGLGTAVAEIVADVGVPVKFKRIGLPDKYLHSVGSQDHLRKSIGLDKDSIVRSVSSFLGQQ